MTAKTPVTSDSVLADTIGVAVMRDAILRSGYLLERRVAAVLAKAGYKAVTNRGFTDPETGKSREYDVYGYKDIAVYGTGSHGIFPTLVCECKNNPQPVVFFVKEKGAFEPLIDEVRVSGMPAKIWQRDRYVSVQEFTGVEGFHHYCRPEVPVASQYCTFQLKKDRDRLSWMAHHTDEQRDTFTSLIKALEFEINEDFKNWSMEDDTKKEFVDLSFYYPLVIFGGDIYSAHIEDELSLEKREHVQLNIEFFSFYDNDVISYHMDVISEKYLPSYLNVVDREMLRVKRMLQRQKQEVLLSIDKIAQDCKALKKKPKSCRKYLEFDLYG